MTAEKTEPAPTVEVPELTDAEIEALEHRAEMAYADSLYEAGIPVD